MAKMMSNANSVTFAKGGTTKMFGKQTAGTQQPGVTSHEVSDGGDKFAKGGKGKMFGKGHAGAAEAGVTAKRAQ